VFDFLRLSFKCPIIEAYGVTEISGSLGSTSAWETVAGVSGGPLACLKVKLVDIPELRYLSTDEPPRGEVLVKGLSVFKAYFRNEQ
jgi:long-chain acyl-CoA synthetase